MTVKRKILRILQLCALVLNLAVLSFALNACDSHRQSADPEFDTRVSHPAYADTHPVVLFDEAHHNIHTSGGLYKPFADLITNDGYRVLPNKEKFSRNALTRCTVLVVANALGANDSNDSSAFSDEECNAVRDWVQSGGSLLFITDHAPTGAAAQDLAGRFGVEMSKGFTEDSSNYDTTSGDNSQLVFTRDNGLLADHPITQGRGRTERINRVMTFTGQSLKGGDPGTELLKLGKSAMNRPPEIKVERSGGDTRVLITYGEPVSAKGYSQAVALPFGKGRLVVLGEAAMLTAQLDGRTKKPFGMNVRDIDNRQLALNIMHWLSRIL